MVEVDTKMNTISDVNVPPIPTKKRRVAET